MRRLRTTAIAVSTIVAAGALASGATAASCPDVPIRPTVNGGYPAGCFVYEKVSPEYKGNGEVAGGGALIPGFRVSLSGDHVVYGADSVFLGAPTFPQVNAYYANRQDGGWRNDSISRMLPSFIPLDPAGTESLDAIAPFYMSEDGRWTYLGANLDPDTSAKIPVRGYVLNLLSGASTRFTPTPLDGAGRAVIDPGFGASNGVVVGDNERIVFPSSSILTADASGLTDPSQRRLYSTENGQTTLISRLPDGSPSNGLPADGMGPRGLRRWAVAADGRTVWWASQLDITSPLYRGDVDGSPGTFVNASENTAVSVPPGGGIAVGASLDGTRMLFTSDQNLVTGTETRPAGTRLYLYTHSANPQADQNLTVISTESEPADTSAIHVPAKTAQVSADGRTAYFWTFGKQLVAGGPVGPGQKLYRWHDGQLEYLATAEVASDGLSLTSENGRFYVFDSATSGLTPKPTGGVVQRYVLDAESGQISCVSCPDAGSASGVVPLPFYNFMQMGETERRYVSDDGQVIFETAQRLVSEDTNGLVDVYAWQDGRVRLISSGRSTSTARFADASADGSAVFFVTRDRLSAWDTDTRADLYVAKRDGGIAEPNVRPVGECSGDTCQGAAGGPASLPLLGSVSFVGIGDPPLPGDPERPRAASVVTPRTAIGSAASLRVRVPARGAVRVSGNGVRRASRSTSKAQTVTVPVRLSSLATRRLSRAGAVTVRVSVRYVPSSGAAQTLRVNVRFKKATKPAKARSSRSVVAKGGR